VPRQKIPRPAALSEISEAFDALVRVECGDTNATVATQLDAVDRLRTLAPKLEPESEEALIIAPVLAYLEAEGARYAEMPLGDAIAAVVRSYERLSSAERRKFEHRAWEGIGRLKQRADYANLRSGSSRDAKADTDDAKFNRKVEEALAEIPLPKGKGRAAVALEHLEKNHFHVWTAEERRIVQRRVKRTWFKDRMTASQPEVAPGD
jgi:hypothetical protein